MQQYKVNQDVLQATINYLATKPLKETLGLYQALKASEEIEDKKIVKKTPKNENEDKKIVKKTKRKTPKNENE